MTYEVSDGEAKSLPDRLHDLRARCGIASLVSIDGLRLYTEHIRQIDTANAACFAGLF
jgi:hypothetical protein